MTKDELKRRLRSYQELKAESKQVAELLAEVEANMIGPKGSASDGLPRGSGGEDPMLQIVSRHIALQNKYQIIHAKLIESQLQIENMIDCLDSRERELMRYYYIKGMTWEKVCVAMNYSWRQVHNIHSEALDRLVKYYGEKSA